MGDSYGLDVERRRREISAHHGVPDFVFRPIDVRKGQAQREVGDFLLWVGPLLVIVSHKAREPAAAGQESQQRRRAWLDKNIADGYRQIRGVARNLKSAMEGQLSLESERGVLVPWDPTRIEVYIGAVIVDIPAPEEDYAPSVMNEAVPSLAMLAHDWDMLSQLLPSTTSMIQYLLRRLAVMPRCPLGSELDVFALLVEREHSGEPVTIPEAGLPKGYYALISNSQPELFFGGHPDDRFALVVDSMIEGAADADPALSDAANPLSYLQIVEFLDRIPLLRRSTFGKAVIQRCERVGRDGGRVATRVAMQHGMIVFVTDDGSRVDRAEWLKLLTFARHSQALDAGAPLSLRTLGIATQPIPSGDGRAHDFVFVQGGIRSDPRFRARRDELFGAVDMASLVECWVSSDRSRGV